MSATLDPATRAQLLTAQKNEITEYRIYTRLVTLRSEFRPEAHGGGEEQAQINYDLIAARMPEAERIESDDDRPEHVGSIVLGVEA